MRRSLTDRTLSTAPDSNPSVLMQNLDFDFEKCCVVSLSPINVYACLVCGKYFQASPFCKPCNPCPCTCLSRAAVELIPLQCCTCSAMHHVPVPLSAVILVSMHSHAEGPVKHQICCPFSLPTHVLFMGLRYFT